jgi:hypothetical protein
LNESRLFVAPGNRERFHLALVHRGFYGVARAVLPVVAVIFPCLIDANLDKWEQVIREFVSKY